jgi:hypothetical protein
MERRVQQGMRSVCVVGRGRGGGEGWLHMQGTKATSS